ncbi:hypothetical protein O6H91_Y054100 [Diphasiastrum complanatum]|nr:hypothetical protein O6H91_Y054100 [Diphasiastrum complanatum]
MQFSQFFALQTPLAPICINLCPFKQPKYAGVICSAVIHSRHGCRGQQVRASPLSRCPLFSFLSLRTTHVKPPLDCYSKTGNSKYRTLQIEVKGTAYTGLYK